MVSTQIEPKFCLGDKIFYIHDYTIKNDIIESICYVKSAPYARKGNLDRITHEYAYMVYDSMTGKNHTIAQHKLFNSKEELLKSL